MEFNLIVNNATNKHVWMLVRVCCFHFASAWLPLSLCVRACVHVFGYWCAPFAT